MVVEKNKKDWNAYAEKYDRFHHDEKFIRPLMSDPSRAFHKKVWEMLQHYMPEINGKRICVPSSGDNMAVFAFALMGAYVTSCDISENQLMYAQRIADREGLADRIEFVCADTMTLAEIEDSAYDMVYTSNGVHVWLNNLPSMYQNIYRILKPEGVSMMFDIHPFLRPFGDSLQIKKPYDRTGPFEDETTVNFHWRVQDIMNAILDSGIQLLHMEEMFAEKDYEQPFFVMCEDMVNGAKPSKEEVDRMYDWRQNPEMALPNWMCLVGKK